MQHIHTLITRILVGSVLIAGPGALSPPAAFGQDTSASPVTLDLPEWNPDPENLPPELRPLDIVRPTLPDSVAQTVSELELRVKDFEAIGLTASTEAEQIAAIDEAIDLAQRIIDIRETHQGNAPEMVRWRDADGRPAEWYQLGDAHRRLRRVKLVRSLSTSVRAELALLDEIDDQVTDAYSQNDDAKAERLSFKQWQGRRRVLGASDALTLASQGNSGFFVLRLGDIASADDRLSGALAGFRDTLGHDHPDSIGSAISLGALRDQQGELAEAAKLLKEALRSASRVLDPQHPYIATCVNNLASVRRKQGEFTGAEVYRRWTLHSRTETLGADHPDTLQAAVNLGVLLIESGRIGEAEVLIQAAYRIGQERLGERHRTTIFALDSLAIALASRGALTEATSYLEEAITRRRAVAPLSAELLLSMHSLGAILIKQKRFDDAHDVLEQTLEGYERLHGFEHPLTLSIRYNLLVLQHDQGALSQARLGYESLLPLQRNVLGNRDPATLRTFDALGTALASLGELSEARDILEQAVAGRRQSLGSRHGETVRSMMNLARVLERQGYYADSASLLDESLSAAESLRADVVGSSVQRAAYSGVLHIDQIGASLAHVHLRLGSSDRALDAIERGRSRAALDLLSQDENTLVTALQATGDPGRVAKYRAALDAEHAALAVLREAEARLAAVEREN